MSLRSSSAWWKAPPIPWIALSMITGLVACFAEPTGESQGDDSTGSSDTSTSPTTTTEAPETTTSADVTSTDPSTTSSSESTTEPSCGSGCTTGHCDDAGNCARIVFVSSERYTGNLGGTEGADDKCNTLASLAGLPHAERDGYRAWISTVSELAFDRVGLLADALPFALPDGTRVADSGASLLDAPAGTGVVLLSAIDRDEQGGVVDANNAAEVCTDFPAPMTWTGTHVDGSLSPGSRCEDWKTDAGVAGNGVGRADRNDGTWTNTTCDPACTEMARLYCFQNVIP